MNGKVKFFNEEKRFGFIAGEDGKEYFVHVSGLTEGTQIAEDDDVTFEVTEGDRGLKAVNVSKGDAAPVEAPADEPAEDADDEPADEPASDDEEKDE